MKEKMLDTGRRLCDTMIRKFPDAKDLPPKHLFHYHQGVFLSGMMKIYELCREEKYFEYIKEWVNSCIDEDGTIEEYDPTRLDDIQPGILLFPLFERSGDNRYTTALKTLIDILRKWKKNDKGGFWHKDCHPNQMWLDSLYMSGPIQAEYAAFSGENSFMNEAANQAIIMYENMFDNDKGLMVHAWDVSKKLDWADKRTGLSSEVWGRAQGWYVVAVLDILEFMQKEHPKRKLLIEIEKKLLSSIIKYRDEKTHMWYQVVDKGNCDDNWIENSCSCLFTAAIAKAIRMGVLDKSNTVFADECFEALYNSIDRTDNDFSVNNVCVGTWVGDYDFYVSRPTEGNDLHGVGAYLLMCAEAANLNRE